MSTAFSASRGRFALAQDIADSKGEFPAQHTKHDPEEWAGLGRFSAHTCIPCYRQRSPVVNGRFQLNKTSPGACLPSSRYKIFIKSV